MKPGLNRREHRLRSRGALQRLEPDEGKLSRPVLRGGGGSNAVSLPDSDRVEFAYDCRRCRESITARARMVPDRYPALLKA